MPRLPFLDRILEGPVLLWVLLLVPAVLLVVAYRATDDAYLRRRSVLVSVLVLLFVLLRSWLRTIPEATERFVRVPGTDELVPTMVTSPVYQSVSVAALTVGLLAALLLTSLVVVDLVLVRRARVEVPKILPDVTVLTIFSFGVLLILYYRTTLDITGLFTTSAVLSVVIGLALQDTLGNLFSGVALQAERSFHVGDWVRFGEQEGVITDVSWRSTRIRTRQNDLIVVPNTVIGKEQVLNYSAPSRVHAITSQVGCHYRHPPAMVIAALEAAALETEGILARPRPNVRLTAFGDFAITYEVRYWIHDYADEPEIRNALMIRVWYAFSRGGIEIPFPIRDVFLRDVTSRDREVDAESDLERVTARIRRCDLFQHLTPEQLESLAEEAHLERFYTGETVLRQGDPGDSLYVIDEGRVEVLLEDEGARERVAELGSPAFFGEMSLMTGDPRSATVRTLEPTRFVVIGRDAVRRILEEDPAVAARISETLAGRRTGLESTAASLATDRSADADAEKHRILSRIRKYFGF